MRTRFGEVEKVGFWLRDGDAAVQGSAWRSKAREMAEIEEGSRIRLKWVSIRTNIFNEPEIQLDEDSIIEVLEKSKEDGKLEGWKQLNHFYDPLTILLLRDVIGDHFDF